ncbi:hypothetical protein [Rathayibacter sp. VKM Ac-2801]|uniref:hypothetical protein n=1 Tax=Rathayibacter sp. VKM Ac-2801 TaxID=2609255 RepID=UPI00131FA418|nr:hypothetical protein [Rathayibacter sp. VKM Ac-2801]QHC71796.1 hypothetical protein GSU45_16315 [Rathayibacter sp. VKM Ac-2801]
MTDRVQAGVQHGDVRGILARRWFAVTASLLLAFGWLLIPGVGWPIGAVLVLWSSWWTGAEKRSALAIPLVAAALVGSGVGLFFGLHGVPSSNMTTWTAVGAAAMAGGAASVVLGVRLCARALRRPASSGNRSVSVAAPAGAHDAS